MESRFRNGTEFIYMISRDEGIAGYWPSGKACASQQHDELHEIGRSIRSYSKFLMARHALGVRHHRMRAP